MAAEYLKRILTSSSTNKQGTISCWYRENQGQQQYIFSSGYSNTDIGGANDYDQIDLVKNSTGHIQLEQYGNRETGSRTNYYVRNFNNDYIDSTSWYHLCVKFDMTAEQNERAILYINGVRSSIEATSNPFSSGWYMALIAGAEPTPGFINIGLGAGITQYGGGYSEMQLFDYYFVDGVALDPSVFAYTDGNRNNQWRPTLPKKVKAAINQAGGFGVNGFYLPMNNAANPGADFHSTPDTILKINDNIPQPTPALRNNTETVREDPYAAYLELAMPFSSTLTDYSGKLGGTTKTTTNTGVTISNASTVYYEKSAYFDGDVIAADGLTAGLTGDFTFEVLANLTGGTGGAVIFGDYGVGNLAAPAFQLGFNATTNVLFVYSGSYIFQIPSFKNQWQHICLERYDGILTLYVDGVAKGSVANTNTLGNQTTKYIGADYPGSDPANQEPFVGYLQDLRLYVGVAKYKGGFDAPRHFSVNGFGATENRISKDTATNKFATFNHFDYQDVGTIDSGALSCNSTNNTRATIAVNSGKWYAEFRRDDSAGSVNHFGVANQEVPIGTSGWSSGDFSLWRQDGFRQHNSVQTSIADTYAQGDIVSVLLDFDNETVSYWKNGQAVATLTNLAFPSNWYNTDGSFKYLTFIARPNSGCQATANFGQNPTFVGRDATGGTYPDSNDIGAFYYQPPAGFLALCEKNLPKPAIDPSEHFKVVSWTGVDNTSGRSIRGTGFKPDLVWTKNRDQAWNHLIYDSIRGPGSDKELLTNSTVAEGASDPSEYDYLSSFDDDGFSSKWAGTNTTDYFNTVDENYVAWCWNAGNGDPVSNTQGSVTSTVKANTAAGFSIVSYPGNQGSDYTIGHGLSKAPEIVITKGRSGTSAWGVYYTVRGVNTNWARLDTTDIQGNNSATLTGGAFLRCLDSTLEISTTAFADEGANIIAYCWHSVPGYSKIGVYEASTAHPQPGAFVYTGFKPAFVMWKNLTDVQTYSSWVIQSNHHYKNNPVKGDKVLYANSPQAEGLRGEGSAYVSGVNDINFLANGFSLIDGSSYEAGNNSASYVYIAFAESPFQNSNGR